MMKRFLEQFVYAAFVSAVFSGCTFSTPEVKKVESAIDVHNQESTESTAILPRMKLEKAIALYSQERNISASMQSVKALTKAAAFAEKKDDFDAGFVLAQQILKLDPDNAYAYYLRGISQYNNIDGETKDAVDDIKKSIELAPREDFTSNACQYLARIYYDHKDLDNAIEMMTKAIFVDPQKRDAYKYRAFMYRDKGEFDKAEADYNKCAELSKKGTVIYFFRAQFYESQNRWQEALNDYDTMVNNVKRRKKVKLDQLCMSLKHKAHLLTKLKRYEEALQVMNESLAAVPTNTEELTMRGDIFVALKRNDEALADYTKAIELYPGKAKAAYEGRSKLYMILKEPEKAKEDAAVALKIEKAPAEKPLYEMKSGD